MRDDERTDDGIGAIQVACDTAVSGCVFRMRTAEADRSRLLEVARAHVRDQHDQDYSLDEIEERYVEEVPVEADARGW